MQAPLSPEPLLPSMTKGYYWYPQPKDAAELNKIEELEQLAIPQAYHLGDGLLVAQKLPETW